MPERWRPFAIPCALTLKNSIGGSAKRREPINQSPHERCSLHPYAGSRPGVEKALREILPHRSAYALLNLRALIEHHPVASQHRAGSPAAGPVASHSFFQERLR